MIVDIMHGLAYRWQAAQVLCAPEAPHAAQGVADTRAPLLHGQGSTIVRRVWRAATLKGVRTTQRASGDPCPTDLAQHVSYLNYPPLLCFG